MDLKVSSVFTAAGAMIAAMLLTAASSAQAKNYVYATAQESQSGMVQKGEIPLAQALNKASGGAMHFKVVSGGQLVSFHTTLSELRNGLVDAAFVVPVFSPKELRNNVVLFNMQVFGDDSIAASGAVDETILLDCPQCLRDYSRNNAIVLAAYDNEPYGLVCRKEVKTLADVKGLKIRTVGAGASLIKFMGAVPVNMSPAAATTALQRGGVDCVHSVLNWLKNFGYWDVAKYYLQTFLGSPRTMAPMVMNRKVWDSLPLSQKKIVIRAMPRLIGNFVFVVDREGNEKVRAEAIKKGVKFDKGGKDFAAMIKRFKVKERKTIIAKAKKLGATDPAQIIATFEKNYKKWQKIAKTQIKGNQAAFEKALWQQIYSKLDPAKL